MGGGIKLVMTRKYEKLLAKFFKEHKFTMGQTQYGQKMGLLKALAEELAKENKKFNKQKFIESCF